VNLKFRIITKETSLKQLLQKLVIVLSLLLVGSIAQAFSFLDAITDGIETSLTPEQRRTPARQPVATVRPKKTIVSKQIGIAKKNTNMRAGPGTGNKKIGRISQGTEVSILETRGQWLHIQAPTASGFLVGWAYAPLIKVETVQHQVASASDNKRYPGNRSNLYYAGYSKDFQAVKQSMLDGDLQAVEDFYSQREKKIREESQSEWQLIENIGLLRWMERGTLSLDSGNLEEGIRDFGRAEDIMNVRQQDSEAEDLLTSFMTFTAETITGNEEFQEYPGEGYEKVLMLNYKSIAYLLDGKRKAYNVTRRAIDWQNMEKQKFQDELSEAKEKQASQGSNTASDNNSSDWQASYKALDEIAEKVPSAYVNPFGYYIAGMIQEFESKDDRSLRDNARISYEKALELNPKSKVIKQAVKDMQKKQSKDNKRLLHVVVADGFAPEKKMLLHQIPTSKGLIPIKLSIYEPTPSSVARIEVQTASGKRLAKLSPVADVEALCLRHQKDTEAFRSLRVGLAIARSAGVNQATSQLGVFGALLGNAVNDMAAPDMRSWMSLPATIQAARLRISKKVKQVKIVTYAADGRRLSSKTVKLSTKTGNFVYARSLEKQLYAIDAKQLWL